MHDIPPHASAEGGKQGKTQAILKFVHALARFHFTMDLEQTIANLQTLTDDSGQINAIDE